jgi:restriction system protein
MDETYHYPPELLQLLIETVPRLSRSKPDTLLFFRGAGTPEELLADLRKRVGDAPNGVSKFEIARTVLTRLNEGGDTMLRVRREVVKRVAEFDDFSRCWPNDQLQARGLVSQVRELVNVKDSFTRMNLERQREQDAHRAARRAEAEQRVAEAAAKERAASDLFALFAETNASRRGRALEPVFNGLFALDGMLVRDAFTRRGEAGEGVLEQVDGVVQLDGATYLVEMKWWDKPLGPGEVAQHLVRLFGRSDVRGLIVSATGFTPAAIESCRDALRDRVVVLMTLEEIVAVLTARANLAAMLRDKATAAMLDRRPFAPYSPRG